MGKGTIVCSNIATLGYVTFTKDGAGQLRLSSANLVTTANPAVEIKNGTLQIAGFDNNLPTAGVLQVDSNGIFDLSGVNQTVAALTGSGVIKNSTGTSTLTVGNNDASGSFSGRSSTGSGILAVTKTGAGTQIMNGTGAFVHTGNTTISGGALIFASGATCPNSSFMINSGSGNTLGVQLATAGGQWACSNLVFGATDSGTYALSVDYSNTIPSTTSAPIICSNLTPHSTITVTVKGFPSSFATLGTYPLISYNPTNATALSSGQFADFSLAPLPSGYTGNLVNDTANFLISLQITGVPCTETVTISPSSPLPTGAVDVAYSQTLTGGGGTGPYSFSVIAGSLPGGFTLDSGGLLSGSTTAAGTFNFTVQVTDTATSCFNNYPYSVTINPGAIASYTVTAVSPQIQYNPFSVTVIAEDAHGNTVTTDSSTQVTMSSSTGNVQFDSNGDGTYGDATKTLSAGTFTIQAKDNVAESVGIIATDASANTGTSSSITISPPVNLTWDPGKTPATGSDGAGTWQSGLGTWAVAGSDVVWSQGANAIIGSGGTAGTINFKSVTVANLTFNQTSSGGYVLSAANTGIQLTFNSGTVTVNNTAALTTLTKLTLAGAVTFTKSGGGILGLSSCAATYSGSTVVAGGTLRILNNTQQLPLTAPLEVDATATFDLGSKNQIVDALTGSGIVDNESTAGSSVLTVGNNNGSGVFSGVLQNSSGSTTLGLTKAGGGTQTLNNANTYAGITTISNGTLALGSSGSIANSARIIVYAGGTFDVSALASYAPGGATTNLIAIGTGTAVGTTAAAINGGTTVDLSAVSRIILTNDSIHPSLFISQGTLALNNNTFYIYSPDPPSVLPDGDYTIIQQASGSISGTVAGSTVTGNAVTGKNSSVSIVGGTVVLHVCTAPGAAGTITGPTTVNPGDSAVAYSITAVSGATSYTWTVPTGASVASGQGSAAITVNYACGAVSGNVGVTPVNTCANGTASSLAVTVNPLPTTSPISGPTTVNANQAGVGYSVTSDPGSSYAWTVPGGASVTAGAGTSSITVTFGTASGNVGVTETTGGGCALAPVSLPVTVNSVLEPPVIISEGIIGSNFQLTISGPSGQTWKVVTNADVTVPLGSWSTMSSGTFTASPTTVTDPSGTAQPGLFYRVISP
jgi:autotransporter-associated beta strand protein